MSPSFFLQTPLEIYIAIGESARLILLGISRISFLRDREKISLVRASAPTQYFVKRKTSRGAKVYKVRQQEVELSIISNH